VNIEQKFKSDFINTIDFVFYFTKYTKSVYFLKQNMEKILEKLNYFTNQDIAKFVRSENVNTYANRYINSKKIIRLKRWIYVSKERLNFIEKNNYIDPYISHIATNILISPSYLSTEYVLYKNAIITENIYSITAITTKKTNEIKNIFWKFVYRNLDDKLFWWYKTIKKSDFIYFEAYPEKALLDWLRLKKDIVFSVYYFQELRLNLENIDFTILEDFVKKFNKTKITKSFNLLKKMKW